MITVALIFIAVILFVIFLQPENFKYSSSLIINAAPSEIFPHINNPKKFNEWNPWAKLDPDCTYSIAGPEEGEGTILSWDGNGQVGKGSMTCIKSIPHELIQFKMEFMKPMKAEHKAEFSLKPEGSQTTVTWSMSGKNNFMGKAVGLIMNCEKMVCGQFQSGLKNLKSAVEK